MNEVFRYVAENYYLVICGLGLFTVGSIGAGVYRVLAEAKNGRTLASRAAREASRFGFDATEKMEQAGRAAVVTVDIHKAVGYSAAIYTVSSARQRADAAIAKGVRELRGRVESTGQL